MATDKQTASNSNVDLKAIADVLAAALTAKALDKEGFRATLAKAAGNGIAADQADKILAKAGFDADHGVRPQQLATTRQILILGADAVAKIDSAAKKAMEDKSISGNWTVIANAIAKRMVDDKQPFDAAKAAAIQTAKRRAAIDAAKAVAARAAKMLRAVQKDFGLDGKDAAKLETALTTLEKLA